MQTWFEEAQKQCVQKWAHDVREHLLNELENRKSREENTMKVSYKGMTGLLKKLECEKMFLSNGYSLEIWDCSRDCTISFSDVSIKDVKFLGGEVTYG